MRDLVNFLRVDGHREALTLEAKAKKRLDHAKVLRDAPTSILKLRWGTVCSCSDDLGKQEEALLEHFRPADLFPASEEARKAHAVIRKRSFWVKNDAVKRWT